MATYNAVKNGNWSDPTVWHTGVVPVSGDIAQLAGFTITFDVDQSAFANGVSLSSSAFGAILDISRVPGNYFKNLLA